MLVVCYSWILNTNSVRVDCALNDTWFYFLEPKICVKDERKFIGFCVYDLKKKRKMLYIKLNNSWSFFLYFYFILPFMFQSELAYWKDTCRWQLLEFIQIFQMEWKQRSVGRKCKVTVYTILHHISVTKFSTCIIEYYLHRKQWLRFISFGSIVTFSDTRILQTLYISFEHR